MSTPSNLREAYVIEKVLRTTNAVAGTQIMEESYKRMIQFGGYNDDGSPKWVEINKTNGVIRSYSGSRPYRWLTKKKATEVYEDLKEKGHSVELKEILVRKKESAPTVKVDKCNVTTRCAGLCALISEDGETIRVTPEVEAMQAPDAEILYVVDLGKHIQYRSRYRAYRPKNKSWYNSKGNYGASWKLIKTEWIKMKNTPKITAKVQATPEMAEAMVGRYVRENGL